MKSHASTRMPVVALFVILLFGATSNQRLFSQDQQSDASQRWLLLCCGLPGDEGHRERLTEACRKVIASADSVLGVSTQRIRVLAGDDQMLKSLSSDANVSEVCTKETLASAFQGLVNDVGPDDSCWVVLLGHAHLYDGRSQFNILGPDIDQVEFATLAKSLSCREQVFWITMPISGFWIRPLSQKSRVVISATEADLEFTGTEMPYALADLLAGDGEEAKLEDVDRDGSLSLLDLYLAVNLEIHGRFQALERLQTEHALLDDNGDGRGTEIQLPYLPVEKEDDEGDEEQAKVETPIPNPIRNVNLDGYRSRRIPLVP